VDCDRRPDPKLMLRQIQLMADKRK
jgi:hypothetical protein